MKNFLRSFVIIVSVFVFLLSPIVSFAEVKEIISEGTYNMGDGETPLIAESRALLQAKRIALEQAGTYVDSYSKVKNFQLTGDEIQVLASGLIEVEVLERKRTIVGDGITFWIKIKAYSGPRNLDSVISYTWDTKRGGPSGTNAQEVSAFI